MSSKAYIKQAIKDRVGNTNYNQWTVGITSDPNGRERQHGNPDDWWIWDAEDEPTAREIEKYFLDLGMKGDTGGGSKRYVLKYVYIF